MAQHEQDLLKERDELRDDVERLTRELGAATSFLHQLDAQVRAAGAPVADALGWTGASTPGCWDDPDGRLRTIRDVTAHYEAENEQLRWQLGAQILLAKLTGRVEDDRG